LHFKKEKLKTRSKIVFKTKMLVWLLANILMGAS